ncbi:hypothetical protein GCM10011492_23250 [Flexivirga endophytica]|uniref:Methyltransferase domain-containing protein n=2 Tax=Flexivirga endophytica TaxID=1849103 RepID=A0A916T7A1_9MICO|nr:hypothetical protein GCM10011492_23250 [Flexivirga endophytica]GHB52890.1 hypothetical protein GCM10008112_22530 [Flexivirga endophytica]
MTFHHTDTGVSQSVWADHPSVKGAAEATLAGVRHIVVVAAHPDDETLGAGGLIATATAAGIPVDLLIFTAGECSHPGSPTHDKAALTRIRSAEAERAATALGLRTGSVRVGGIPDGQVADHVEELTASIVAQAGRLDRAGEVLIVAPYRQDGHPDHDAAGAAAAAAAHRTDASLLEYPIWFRHQYTPDDLQADRLQQLHLTPAARAAKRRAIDAHRSQVRPLSDQPGDEAILQPDFLRHFAEPDSELFLHDEVPPDTVLDELHQRESEPWGADSRWYEQRKRQLALAMLPRARFGQVLEVGCSTGVLTAQLAGMADRVMAIDSSPAAIAAATSRVPANVELATAQVPDEWPRGSYDLVVFSEVGYFLSPAALARTIARIERCLAPEGVVLLSHWRHPIDGWPLDAAAVHHAFAGSTLPPSQAVYRDRDVEMILLCDLQQLPDPGA